MYKKGKEEVTIIKINRECTFMKYSEIRDVFLSDLRQFLYLVDDEERLVGILSIGDVKKREDDKVYFNRNFSKLYEWNVIKAKKIFKERERILEIPILDDCDRIVGAYVRRDELLQLEYLKEYINETDKESVPMKQNLKVHIVDSEYKAAKKNLRTVLENVGMDCDIIPVKNIQLELGGGYTCL